MKIVIELDDNVFVRLFDNGIDPSKEDREEIEGAIRYGIVLPKGHGRLVDANECNEKMIKYGFRAPDMTVTEFVEDELTTVIPADTENQMIRCGSETCKYNKDGFCKKIEWEREE